MLTNYVYKLILNQGQSQRQAHWLDMLRSHYNWNLRDRLNQHWQKLFKPVILGTGACLFLNSPVQAVNTITIPATPTHLLAQSQRRTCPNKNTILLRYAETNNYDIFICSAESDARLPKYYVSLSKHKTGDLTLPLSSRKGEIYIARNGSYTYTLDLYQDLLTIVLPDGKRITERAEQFYD